jgi:hypothetical protein
MSECRTVTPIDLIHSVISGRPRINRSHSSRSVFAFTVGEVKAAGWVSL